MFLDRLKIKLIILLVSFFIMPTILSAWTEGLEPAAKALHNGTATPTQRFFVHEHINEINNMKLSGDLPDNIYQSSQGDFYDRNIANLKDAASKEGFKIELNKPDRFEAGTDTDAPLTRQAGSNTDITVDKLKKVEKRYKNNMKKDYKKAGLKAPEKLADTNTDILVDPDATSEFQKCAAHVNNNGGTAYTNPDAGRAEIKMGRGEPISIKESSAYTDEVGRLANEKSSKARDLRHKAQATQNYDPAKAKKLRAQAQLNDSQASKYINRSDKATNNLRRQHGLDDLPIDTKSGLDKAIRKIDKNTGLGRGIATKNDAIAIGNMHKHASEKAGQKFIDTLGDIAKESPHVAKDAQKAIAKSLNKMSPSAQGHALDNLERKLGKSFTKNVVKNAKALRAAKKIIPSVKPKGLRNILTKPRTLGATGQKIKIFTGRTMHYGMIGLGAFFMGKDGVYHALKKVKHDSTVTDFVLDVFAESVYHGSGFGYAWEEAVAEMKQDYAKQLVSGKPPSISRDIGVTVVKTGFYMGRDLVVMAIYLPDMIYELITGEKDAQRREDYSKQFLAAVQKKMRQKKALEDAKADAKKDGIYVEDLIPYFHCLCSKGCTMMLGGYYDPGFDGDGHGNCKCSGPYNSFKTPMAGNKNDKNGCFNNIVQMNYNKNRAIFDKWNKAAIANNAESVKKEVQVIENNISNGTIMEITNLFKAIEPLLYKSKADEFRNKIDSGLRKQAREHISDVTMEKPLHTAVNKIQKAIDLYKGKGGLNQNRRENLEKTLAQYTMWEKNWNKFIREEAPAIEKLLHTGQVYTAQNRRYAVSNQAGKNLPNRYKDPVFLKLDKLQREKYLQRQIEYEKLINTLSGWKKKRDPRGTLKKYEKFYADWEVNPIFKESYNRTLHDLKQAVRIAEKSAKWGDTSKKNKKLSIAVSAYRASLKIQKDTLVQRKLDDILEKISSAKKILVEARKEWISGHLEKAIQTIQTAKDSKEIAKTFKAMQGQKKMMDNALKKAGQLIGQKKFDQAKGVLKKAERISSKYPPYVEMAKKLKNAKEEDEKLAKGLLKKINAIKKAKEAEKQAVIVKKIQDIRDAADKAAKEQAEADKKDHNLPDNTHMRNIQAKYIGCYRDRGADESTKGRDISGYYFTSSSMTIDKCTTSCLERGFKYAGAQYEYGCFCGNRYGRDGKADNCNMPCSGNKNEICGGAWANSVYALTGKKDVADSTQSGFIKIISATYGANCGATSGNATPHIAKQCNKKSKCQYTVDHKKIGDPSYGCKKIYTVQYRCGNNSQVFKESLLAEAGWGDKFVSLDCQQDNQPTSEISSPATSDAIAGKVKPAKGKLTSDISSLVGSWNFGRSKHHGKPVQEHLCNLLLTDDLVSGKGYKIRSCHANESYWVLEGNVLLFTHLDGTITTKFTQVRPNYWEGTYVGSAHTGEGVVHYLKK